MQKYLMMIAALSLVMSGCGKDEEPMEEQAAEETVMEQEADTTMDTMQEEAGAVEEEGGAAMENEPAPANGEVEPEASPDGETSMEESSSMTEESVVEADAAQGKQVYDQACFTCHAQGIAGAPKIGDKALWEPRIAKGMDTLVNNAINGFQGESGVMPPKGGFMNLSDEEVTAAVAYMVAESQ